MKKQLYESKEIAQLLMQSQMETNSNNEINDFYFRKCYSKLIQKPEIYSKGTYKRNEMSMEPIIGTFSKKVDNNRTI